MLQPTPVGLVPRCPGNKQARTGYDGGGAEAATCQAMQGAAGLLRMLRKVGGLEWLVRKAREGRILRQIGPNSDSE